jgi:hypothetical protein
MPVTTGRTNTQIAVTQGAAGSLDLVAAPGVGMRIYVISIILVADGALTLKFTEGVGPTDLTGAISLAANGGFVEVGTEHPILKTNTTNSKLSLVTTTSAIKGWLAYFIA